MRTQMLAIALAALATLSATPTTQATPIVDDAGISTPIDDAILDGIRIVELPEIDFEVGDGPPPGLRECAGTVDVQCVRCTYRVNGECKRWEICTVYVERLGRRVCVEVPE